MKKIATTTAIILLVIAMAVSAAGCGDKTPPAPEPTQSAPVSAPPPPQRPSPAPPQSPSPSPTPVIQESITMLVLEEDYCMDGDPGSYRVMFFDDGTVRDQDGIEGEFEIDGNMIRIYLNAGLAAELLLKDDYTLEDADTGVLYIREGGAGYGGYDDNPADYDYSSDEPSFIVFRQYYYLDGDSGNTSLYFYDDGDVDIEYSGESLYGEYTIDGDEVTVTIDGQELAVFYINDPVTLEDSDNGAVYTFEDGLNYNLEYYEYYYLSGDEDELSLWFRDDGTVDVDSPSGDTQTFDYELYGDMIYIDYNGEEVELEVITTFLLKDGDGYMYIRMP